MKGFNDNVLKTFLSIPAGYTRFGLGFLPDGKSVFHIFVSDTKASSIGLDSKAPENETLTDVFSIELEDYRQAEVYAKMFSKLAEKMKAKCSEMKEE